MVPQPPATASQVRDEFKFGGVVSLVRLGLREAMRLLESLRALYLKLSACKGCTLYTRHQGACHDQSSARHPTSHCPECHTPRSHGAVQVIQRSLGFVGNLISANLVTR